MRRPEPEEHRRVPTSEFLGKVEARPGSDVSDLDRRPLARCNLGFSVIAARVGIIHAGVSIIHAGVSVIAARVSIVHAGIGIVRVGAVATGISIIAARIRRSADLAGVARCIIARTTAAPRSN